MPPCDAAPLSAPPCAPRSAFPPYLLSALPSSPPDGANAILADVRPTAPAAKGSCVTPRSALHAATRRSLPANASARLVYGSHAGLSSCRVQPAASILHCLASVAAASHRLDAPSKARSQWPAAATALRAFLLSHDAFLPAQILPPACWAICLRVRLRALFLPLVSLPHRAYLSP